MQDFRYAVVCVDDDPIILQVLSFQLEKIIDKKCTLLEYFTDPVVALDSIDELMGMKIDVIFVIVDYQMPQMNGAQLVRAIKEKYPDMSCVMLSGQANSVQVTDLMRDKMLREFVVKPWEEKTLFSVLQPIIKDHKC
jgi:CheY-like chemotaxis protein